MSRFANDFPAVTGGNVTQGHADYCQAHGHATHTITNEDGSTEVAPYCPRCYENLPRYTASALKTGLTDAVEIADRIEAELASRGCALVEVTRVEVVNGKIWFRILVSWNDSMDNGTQLERLSRIDEDGQVRMEVSLRDAYAC